MGDFPPEWVWLRDLQEGGQGHTFVVRRSNDSDSNLYVLKRLKNPNRQEYFEREIQACSNLDHRNVLKVLSHGRTPKGKPFLITEYCDGGSLSSGPKFDSPVEGLRFFQQIATGVAHAHSHEPPIYHLDLKPENILLKGRTPVVGDFGICFIEEDRVSLTREGPRGSMYYCAPELRDPKIPGNTSLALADIYSLGKILYWLFTLEVFDGHEEDYSGRSDRLLVNLFASQPQFAFIDEIIGETVQRNPAKRIANAVDLATHVQRVIERIEAGGRVLDLRVPQKCLYCAVGRYQPRHESAEAHRYAVNPKFPDVDKRRVPSYNPLLANRPSPYEALLGVARPIIGLSNNPDWIPLLLICDHCGNVQYFRLDLTADKHGENWRP